MKKHPNLFDKFFVFKVAKHIVSKYIYDLKMSKCICNVVITCLFILLLVPRFRSMKRSERFLNRNWNGDNQ